MVCLHIGCSRMRTGLTQPAGRVHPIPLYPFLQKTSSKAQPFAGSGRKFTTKYLPWRASSVPSLWSCAHQLLLQNWFEFWSAKPRSQIGHLAVVQFSLNPRFNETEAIYMCAMGLHISVPSLSTQNSNNGVLTWCTYWPPNTSTSL